MARRLLRSLLAASLLVVASPRGASARGRRVHGQVAATTATTLPALSVELHSHLFMKLGLGWLFRGDFTSPPASRSWEDRLSSEAGPAEVERSGIGLLVVTLFAHPLAHLDLRASVQAQIAAARSFATSHPRWQLARSAGQARQILQSGGRAMVLALEGAAGVLDSEEDLRQLVDRQGIAIVTPLHLVDDRNGGVATLNGFQYFGNPLGLADRLLNPHRNSAGVETNPRGLSARGRRLVTELIARGVWIDLSHASDAALTDLLSMLRAAGQPLLITHTTLRRFRPAERATTDAMLHKVAESGGVVGLVPSEDAFLHLRVPPRFCPRGCTPERCSGSVSAFATMYAAAAAIVGAEAVVLGSDHNGGMRHLAQACGTGTSLDGPGGLHSIAQAGELWSALRRVGAPVPPLERSLARVLDAWAQVRPVRLPTARLPPWPAHSQSRPRLRGTLGAGVASTSRHAPPGPSLRVNLRIAADGEAATMGEPDLYFAHTTLDLVAALQRPIIPYLDARLAPFGIGVERDDDRVWGELLVARLGRHQTLDEAFWLQLSVIGGAIRTVPGLAKVLGRHHLFVELSADFLGYQRTAHSSPAPATNALHAGGAALTVGATLYPERDVRLVLSTRAGGDVDLSFAGARIAYQSDVDLGGRLTVLFIPAGAAPFFEAAYLGRRESQRDKPWRATPRLAGGLLIALP